MKRVAYFVKNEIFFNKFNGAIFATIGQHLYFGL